MKRNESTAAISEKKKKERLELISVYQGDILLSVKEAKMVLDVTSDKQIYDLINKGLLDYLIIGSKKIRRSTLDAFMAKYEGCDLNKILSEISANDVQQ